jgi:hypothetical protein
MGRKPLLTLLAALVAFTLVPAGGASAAKPLTEERAFVLASKVGREVAKQRNARYWRIQRLVKKRTNRFVFEYLERLREDNRYCLANVVVVQSGNRRTASLTGSRCGTVRADVLAAEEAVSDGIRELLPRAPDVRAAVNAHEKGLEACEPLAVPARYEDDVDHFLELGTEAAMYSAVSAELDAHANRLARIETADSVLRAGIASWRKHIEIMESVPEETGDPCPALRRWERDDFSDASRPDFERTNVLYRSLVRHGRRMLDAGDRVYELGASDRTLAAFMPYGLVVAAAVEYDKQN